MKDTEGAGKTRSGAAESGQVPPHRAGPRQPTGADPTVRGQRPPGLRLGPPPAAGGSAQATGDAPARCQHLRPAEGRQGARVMYRLRGGPAAAVPRAGAARL